MARMSVDDSFLRDPRVRRLASLCGWSRRETMGALLDVWAVAYDRAKPTIHTADIDIAAELPGFTDKMVEAGLAQRRPGGRGGGYGGEVWLSGVSKRVEYLGESKSNGAKGGRKSGEVRRASRIPLKGSARDPQGSTNLPDRVPDSVPVPDAVNTNPRPSPPARSESQTRAREPVESPVESRGTWLEQRRALGDRLWAELTALRARLASEHQLEVRPLSPMDAGRAELANRLAEAGPDRAEADARHVLAILEAEAMAKGTVEWVTGSAFQRLSWDRKLAMTVDDARRVRGNRQAQSGEAIGPASPRHDHGVSFEDFGDAIGTGGAL